MGCDLWKGSFPALGPECRAANPEQHQQHHQQFVGGLFLFSAFRDEPDRDIGLIPNCCSTLGTRLQKALAAKAELGLLGGPVWQRQLLSAALCSPHVLSWPFPPLWPEAPCPTPAVPGGVSSL